MDDFPSIQFNEIGFPCKSHPIWKLMSIQAMACSIQMHHTSASACATHASISRALIHHTCSSYGNGFSVGESGIKRNTYIHSHRTTAMMSPPNRHQRHLHHLGGWSTAHSIQGSVRSPAPLPSRCLCHGILTQYSHVPCTRHHIKHIGHQLRTATNQGHHWATQRHYQHCRES